MNLTNDSTVYYPNGNEIMDCGGKSQREGYCPEVFDGLLCWSEAAAGTMANQSCPLHLGYDYKRLSYKECWENGTWFIHPESNRTWTNYTTCVDKEDLEFREYINHLYVIGYTVSLVALVISLFIFLMFQSLKCTRIRIHIQLFLSFALNNCMWIIWYKEVIQNTDVTIFNMVWCQVLFIVIQYLMLANYMWMFCEALHLHIALVVVFVRDEVTMLWFHGIGWIIPLIFVGAYSFVRLYVTQDTHLCWIHEKNYYATWILTTPVLISLVVSLVFFANVLRIILTIMHPNSTNPAPLGMKRVARAALILIPLFGLQHLIIPFRPKTHSEYERLYEYVSVGIVSLQGLCVSCLFCFINQDVHQAIRNSFRRSLHRNFRWSQYHYTGTNTGDSAAGVFMLNGNSQSSFPMLSIRRKSTATTVNL